AVDGGVLRADRWCSRPTSRLWIETWRIHGQGRKAWRWCSRPTSRLWIETGDTYLASGRGRGRAAAGGRRLVGAGLDVGRAQRRDVALLDADYQTGFVHRSPPSVCPVPPHRPRYGVTASTTASRPPCPCPAAGTVPRGRWRSPPAGNSPPA